MFQIEKRYSKYLQRGVCKSSKSIKQCFETATIGTLFKNEKIVGALISKSKLWIATVLHKWTIRYLAIINKRQQLWGQFRTRLSLDMRHIKGILGIIISEQAHAGL